jgi:hypothetical protein
VVRRILRRVAATRPSKNKLTTDQLKIACRHVRELIDAGVTENLAIRSLEQFADFYAKMHCGGSATPHHVRQVPRRQWSVAAREEFERNPLAKLRVEHGTPRRAFAKKVMDLFDNDNLTEDAMATLIKRFWKLAVITIEEDARLNRIARSRAADSPDERWRRAEISFEGDPEAPSGDETRRAEFHRTHRSLPACGRGLTG